MVGNGSVTHTTTSYGCGKLYNLFFYIENNANININKTGAGITATNILIC